MFDEILQFTTSNFSILLSKIDILHTIPDVYYKYLQFTPLFIIALLTGLLFTPVIGQIAIKLRILDLPRELRGGKKMINQFDDPDRHIHTEPKPFLGGLAVIIPLIVMIFIFLKPTPIIIPIIIGLSIITISGILDDAYNLPATYQLIAQLLASVIIVLSPIDMKLIDNPFNGYLHLDLWSHTFTFLNMPMSLIFPGDILIIPWIILCINALKWVGGSDGLIEGNSLIAFLVLFVLGVRNESIVITTIAVIAAGLILGGFFYNYPPAKIFTGSTGKTAYGFLIATLALVNEAKVSTTIIILALPIIDALLTAFRRYVKYKPKNPLDLLRINDKSHLHHQLMEIGLNQRQILFIEMSIALVVGTLAILSIGANNLFALIGVVATITVGISLIQIRNARKKLNAPPPTQKEESPESKYSY